MIHHERELALMLQTLQQELPENDLFLGGSRRFDYHNRPPNDIDLFVFVGDTSIMVNAVVLRKFVENYGMILTTKYYDAGGDFAIKTNIFGTRFDLNFFLDRDAFTASKQEHYEIEKMLVSNSPLLDYMRSLDMSGVQKYRGLKNLNMRYKSNLIDNRAVVGPERLKVTGYGELASRNIGL